jgi:DNA-binding NarL/FixJ family response regulator
MRVSNTVIINSSSARICREVKGFLRGAKTADKICIATDNNEFKNMVGYYKPRLVFLETSCWYELTHYLIAQYASQFPEMAIAVFGYERLTPLGAARFINLGAGSYVDMRHNDDEELSKAFHGIMNDKAYLPSWVAEGLAKSRFTAPEYPYLVESELPVMRLHALGNSIEDIAAKLGIARGTVRNNISSMHKKFNIQGQAQLTGLAQKIGIVHPDELITSTLHHEKLEEAVKSIKQAGKERKEK